MSKTRSKAMMALSLCGVLALAGCAGTVKSNAGNSGGATPEKVSGSVVKISMADNLTSDDPITMALDSFAAAVKKKSHGTVDITVYPNATLATENNIVSVLRSQTVDMGIAGANYWTTVIPGSDALILPYLATTWPQVKAIADSSKLNSYLRSMYGTQNVHMIANLPNTWKDFISSSPVAKPSDMNGMKVRTAGGAEVQVLQALGANPVTLDSTDIYEGLLTHTISGVDVSASQMQQLKFYEVAKNFTDMRLGIGWVPLFITDKAWAELSPSQRTLLNTEGTVMVNNYLKTAPKNTDNEIAQLKQAGTKIIPIANYAPWEKLVDPVVKKYGQTYVSAGRIISLAEAAAKSAPKN